MSRESFIVARVLQHRSARSISSCMYVGCRVANGDASVFAKKTFKAVLMNSPPLSARKQPSFSPEDVSACRSQYLNASKNLSLLQSSKTQDFCMNSSRSRPTQCLPEMERGCVDPTDWCGSLGAFKLSGSFSYA